MERIAQLLRKMSDAAEDEIQEYLSLHETVSYKKGDILLEKVILLNRESFVVL